MREKSRYFIGYAYQVIIPLMYVREHNNQDIVEITQFQMLSYRISTAQELAYNNINVEYETGNNGLMNFVNEYSNYVEVIDNGDELSYRLKDNYTKEMFDELLSKLDDNIKDILTNKDIISTSINEKSLS